MFPLRGGLAPLTLATKAARNGLLNNLVAYWGLDEISAGSNALDKHSNALALALTNNPGVADGKVYAKARSFDGSTQWFSRNTEAMLSTGDIDFAVAAWVYPTNANATHAIAGKYRLTASANREWLLRISASRYEFRVSATGSFPTVATVANTYGAPALNTWTFVCAWHDSVSNTLNISINNGMVDSVAHTTGVFASNAPLMLGTYDDATPDTFWSGRIGPVKFWKGATLAAAQRTALYNAGAGLAYSAFTA